MTVRDIDDVLGPDRQSIDRYDLLLAAIPLSLLGSILAGELVGVPLEVSAAGGSLLASLALLDGVFFRPPTDPGAA